MRKFNKQCVVKVSGKDYVLESILYSKKDYVQIKLRDNLIDTLVLKIGKLPYALGSKFTSKCGKEVKFKGNLYA